MNIENKIERIERLKNSYRMFHIEKDDDGVNKVGGLFLMIDEIIKPDFVVAEIGSFCGVSSECFAMNCQELHCIDTWEDWNGDGIIFQAMDRFDNMKSLYSNIFKHHMKGEEASQKFDNEYFDLVYIDASHWYKDVINDIETWYPKVKRNGFLSGHDYIHGIDTYNAVNDLFGNTHSITRYPDSSWLIQKK